VDLILRAATHPYTYSIEAELRERAACRRVAHDHRSQSRRHPRAGGHQALPRIASVLGLA
jgi:hypothetical protein